jgi:uncharacterized protein DUF642/PEP-CTERM motif-containing protein
MTRPSMTVMACVVFFLLTAQPANADLLINGSFEQPALGLNGSTGFADYFAGGPTLIPGWTVEAHTVYVMSNYGMPVDSGTQYLNLLSLNSAGAGAVSQVASVTAGATYKLSFDYGGGIDILGGVVLGDSSGNTLTYQLYDGSTGKTLSQGSKLITSSNLNNWTNLTIQAAATSSSLGVRFASDGLGADGYFGAFVDGVSLIPIAPAAVPEPSSFCLAAVAGLFTLAYRFRRR